MTVEDHPKSPDPSPEYGKVWEYMFSKYRQPTTYDQRVSIAKEGVRSKLGKHTLFVIDELTPHGVNNPVYCAYGPAPNSAWLIDQNMDIRLAQQWFKPMNMASAVRKLKK